MALLREVMMDTCGEEGGREGERERDIVQRVATYFPGESYFDAESENT